MSRHEIAVGGSVYDAGVVDLSLPPCCEGKMHLWGEAHRPDGWLRRYCRRSACGLVLEGPSEGPILITQRSIRKSRLATEKPGVNVESTKPRKKKLRLIREQYELHGAICFYCSRDMLPFEVVEGLRIEDAQLPPEYPTLDHVLPKSRGGRLVSGNVVVACQRCNFEKDHKIQSPLG